MLIDHTAIVLSDSLSYEWYMILRGIGRLAFVIFCFFLTEGFTRTRSRCQYALRLALFALISELPFDLLFYGRIMQLSHQNVYFTLLLGLLGLCGYEALRKKNRTVLALLCPLGCAVTAELLHTDYGAGGVLLIAALYLLRDRKLWQGASVLALMFGIGGKTQVLGLGGWLLCQAYNGKRGLNLKYAFYLFYPVHILLLYALQQVL